MQPLYRTKQQNQYIYFDTKEQADNYAKEYHERTKQPIAIEGLIWLNVIMYA